MITKKLAAITNAFILCIFIIPQTLFAIELTWEVCFNGCIETLGEIWEDIVNLFLHKGHSTSMPIHSSWACNSALQCGHFVINSAITAFLFLLKREQKKRHIPKKCPFLRLRRRCKKHISKCAVQNIHGHTDSKYFLQSSIFEVVIQEWTFTISLPNFLFSYRFCLLIPLLFFRKCNTHSVWL